MSSRWQRATGTDIGGGPMTPSTAAISDDFDAFAFERELAAAEEEMQKASRHIAAAQPIEPVTTTAAGVGGVGGGGVGTVGDVKSRVGGGEDDDEEEEGKVFRGFNLLAGGREGLRRQRLAAADARLVNPKATLVITALAWVIAMIVAIIAVAFATKDFVDGMKNPLLATKFERVDRVRLPILSICTSQLDIGGFGLLDSTGKANQYGGIPVFTVRSVQNMENETDIRYWPDVLEGSENGTRAAENGDLVVRGAYRGPRNAECARRFSSLNTTDNEKDKSTSLAREDLDNSCQFCYQIGRDPPLYFDANKERKRSQANPLVDSTGLSLHMVSSSFLKGCVMFDDPTRVGDSQWDFVTLEVKRNAKMLEGMDLLNWSGLNTSNEAMLDRTLLTKQNSFTDQLMRVVEDRGLDFQEILTSAREAVCHAYFWSGIFYPNTEGKPDVRYKYNTNTFQWERAGKGPYFREKRPGEDLIGSLMLEDQGTDYASRPLEIYQEDPETASSEKIRVAAKNIVGSSTLHRIQENAQLIATIEDMNRAEISFKLQKFENKLSLIPTTNLVDVDQGIMRLFFVSYLINFRIDSFEAENITRKDGTSIIQYLVDAVGYISMALGFTVYSLLIGPTNLFFLGVDRPKKKKTNGHGKISGSGESMADAGREGEGDVSEMPEAGTRGGGPSKEGLRFRFGIQRPHYTGPNEPLQRIV